MQVEVGSYGEGMMVVMEEEMQGWETPRRAECRIPVVPPCPPPPRKKAAALLPGQLGKVGRREPPKGGYFQPPDIESFFVLASVPRRQQQLQAASSCA